MIVFIDFGISEVPVSVTLQKRKEIIENFNDLKNIY